MLDQDFAPHPSTTAMTTLALGARFFRLLAVACAVTHCGVSFVPKRCAAVEKSPAAEFHLRDGDRVVFYGDSITEQGHYTLPIETFVLTRLADRKVSFTNSGWGGDRAWGGEGGTLDERLRRDVIAHRPTVVTVMLGMNDAYYNNYSPQAVTAFKASLKHLIETLERELPGVRITLLGTSPYDNVTPGDQPEWEQGISGGYNSVVARFSAATQEVASRHELLFVDMNEPLVKLLQHLQQSHPDLARQLIPDRIHPGPAAGFVMAARLLEAWHAPDDNQTIQINAAHTTGSSFHVQQKVPLPFPLDRTDALTNVIAKSTPELKLLAGDTLRVSILPIAKATLRIDGQSVGDFSPQQLVAGIDLSSFDSPLTRQAAQIAAQARVRSQVQFTRQRLLETQTEANTSPNTAAAAKELAEIEAVIVDLQYVTAQPKTHVFEIIATEQ